MANFKQKRPLTNKEAVVIKRELDKIIGHRHFKWVSIPEEQRKELLETIARESGVYPKRNIQFVQEWYRKLVRSCEMQDTIGCTFCGFYLDDDDTNYSHVKAYGKYYKFCHQHALSVIDGIHIDTGRCGTSKGCYYCGLPQDDDSVTYRIIGNARGCFRLCNVHKYKLNIPRDHPIYTKKS